MGRMNEESNVFKSDKSIRVRDKPDVNFIMREGMYPLYDEIMDDFEKDFMEGRIHTKDLQRKYMLSQREYKEMADVVKQKHDLKRRPSLNWGRHYYPQSGGWAVRKRIDDILYHVAWVDSEEKAKEVVEICTELGWDINECRRAVAEYLGQK